MTKQTNNLFIYVRVSTDKQHLETCLQSCVEYVRRNYAEHEPIIISVLAPSGASTKARRIDELLSALKAGDVLVSTEVSRLARSAQELRKLFVWFEEKGISTVFVRDTHNILSHPKLGGLIREVMSLYAEMEKELISERTKAGLARLKSCGIKLGRPIKPDYIHPNIEKNKLLIADCISRKLNVSNIARLICVSRHTLRAYITKTYGASTAGKAV